MPHTFSPEQIQQHIDSAKQRLMLVSQAFDLLAQSGFYSSELGLSADIAQAKDNAYKAARRRLNAEFCQPYITSACLPYNRKMLGQSFEQAINTENVRAQIDLFNNVYDAEKVLSHALAQMGLSSFEKKIRISSKRSGPSILHEGYLADVVAVLSDLNGLNTDYQEINNQIEFLAYRKEARFDDLGLSITVLANGSINLNLSDSTVQQLNMARQASRLLSM